MPICTRAVELFFFLEFQELWYIVEEGEDADGQDVGAGRPGVRQLDR